MLVVCVFVYFIVYRFFKFPLFFFSRGRIKHTEVCQLLRQMSPPVGIGKKCPKIVAYKVGKSQLLECHSCYVTELKHNNLFFGWRGGLGTVPSILGSQVPLISKKKKASN